MTSYLNNLTVKPATSGLWKDLEILFSNPGDCRFCWCMWWRIKRKQFDSNGAAGNRAAMKEIVESGEVSGLLAYEGTGLKAEPVAWVSVAPRERFPVLDRSPVLKRLDDKPVWSIVCFYVVPELRGQGITGFLIKAAVDYARSKGCTLIEGYPISPEKSKDPKSSAFTGVLSVYKRLGFTIAARRSDVRCIVRRKL